MTTLNLSVLRKYQDLVNLLGGEKSLVVASLYFDFEKNFIYLGDYDTAVRVPFVWSGDEAPNFFVSRQDLLHSLGKSEVIDYQSIKDGTYGSFSADATTAFDLPILEDGPNRDLSVFDSPNKGSHFEVNDKWAIRLKQFDTYLGKTTDSPESLRGVFVSQGSMFAMSPYSYFEVKAQDQEFLGIFGDTTYAISPKFIKAVKLLTSNLTDRGMVVTLTGSRNILDLTDDNIKIVITPSSSLAAPDVFSEEFRGQLSVPVALNIPYASLQESVDYLAHFFKQLSSKRINLKVVSETSLCLTVEDTFKAQKFIDVKECNPDLVGTSISFSGEKLQFLFKCVSSTAQDIKIGYSSDMATVWFQSPQDTSASYLLARFEE